MESGSWITTLLSLLKIVSGPQDGMETSKSQKLLKIVPFCILTLHHFVFNLHWGRLMFGTLQGLKAFILYQFMDVAAVGEEGKGINGQFTALNTRTGRVV